MISYKPVAIQSAFPILTFKDVLGEKIRGNYLSFGLSIQAEDLIFMTIQPLQIYIEKGQYDGIVAEHKTINNNSLKVEMMNQLINRIMFFGSAGFTYQDEVFVSLILHKLGIKNTAGFMAWVKNYREKSKRVISLLKAYREALSDTGHSAEAIHNLRKPFLYSSIFRGLHIVELWENIYRHMPESKAAAALHMLSDGVVLEKYRENLILVKSPNLWQQGDIYDIAVGHQEMFFADHKAGIGKLTELIGGAVLINILQKAVYEQHSNRSWQDYTSYILGFSGDTDHEYTSDTLNIMKILSEKTVFRETGFEPQNQENRYYLTDNPQIIRRYRDGLKLYRDEEKLVRAWSKIVQNVDMGEGGAGDFMQSHTKQTLQSYAQQIRLMLSDNYNLKQQMAIVLRSSFFSDAYHRDSFLSALKDLQAEEKLLLSSPENVAKDKPVALVMANDADSAEPEMQQMTKRKEIKQQETKQQETKQQEVKQQETKQQEVINGDMPVLFDHIMPQEGEMTSEYRQYLEWLNSKNIRINQRFQQEKEALAPLPMIKTDKKRIMQSIQSAMKDPGKMQEILKEIQGKSQGILLPGISREAELLLRLADEPTRTRYEKILGIKAEGAPITEDETPYRDELNKIMQSFRSDDLQPQEYQKEESHVQNDLFLQKLMLHAAQTISHVTETESQIRKASKYDAFLMEYRQKKTEAENRNVSALITREEAAERFVKVIKSFGIDTRVLQSSSELECEAYETGKAVLIHKKTEDREDAFPASGYGRSVPENVINAAGKTVSVQQDHYKNVEFTMQNQRTWEEKTSMENMNLTNAQKEQIREIVRSNINTQLGTLSDRVYQKLDRRLREERKRKGY